ncbi:MAG: rhodanese-like domain-containing protein [Gammaproteobacteria bacterium]
MSELPDILVSTDWLEANLDAPDLRVFDCTVYLDPWPDNAGQTPRSGIDDWRAGHIPGSGFLDLISDFAAPSPQLNFLVPDPYQFADAAELRGIGDGTRVVLYDRALNRWAARMWCMLRAFGLDSAAVLDGGWVKWTREGRPWSLEPCRYPRARFVPRPRRGMLVDQSQVRAAMADAGVHLVNALTVEQHFGREGVHYGRRGHIPGSVNVSARDLVDPQTHAYWPRSELRRRFAEAGVLDGRNVITYCGSGIAASSDALILTALGLTDVAVYTNSLQEWAADPECPMSCDQAT